MKSRGGIAALVIMPRVKAPAYLRYKNTLLNGYKDVRVRVDAQPLNIDRCFRRMTLVALFVLSVLSTVAHYVGPPFTPGDGATLAHPP